MSDTLNPAQREAIETLDGPVLVLSGAGTGKTRVLTARLVHILNTGRAAPHEVLAVTFTNKAAQEMRERVGAMTGAPVQGWWLGTFHALAARMLRNHAEKIGLTSNFTILNQDDQMRLIKQLVKDANLDDKKFPPKLISAIISRWKDSALKPDDVNDASNSLTMQQALRIYHLYQTRLLTLQACDFADLLLHVITILKTNNDIRASYHRQFKYILVDEYQDTNKAQYLWLRLLVNTQNNICCVGDEDQSIYGWRGAEIQNILNFQDDFPAAKLIKLEQNYRSTQPILSAASALIANNKARLGKALWTDQKGGTKIRVRGVWDHEQEARLVCKEIKTLKQQHLSFKDMAILVRAGSQTRAFEERLISNAIPYRVIGGARFYERMEIRDALAYFRVVLRPDDDLAFERIVNTPKRGLGTTSLQKVRDVARAQNISMTQAISQTDTLTKQAKNTLTDLMQKFESWRRQLSSWPEVGHVILEESGYMNLWKADKSLEAEGRVENLNEFLDALAEFENMDAFLEHVALVMDIQADSNKDSVSLMTLHSAKGLEFFHVFLPGWEEGLFPSARTMDESGEKGLEEERRLAYVGLTRARKSVMISYAANRLLYGQWNSTIPSRFIDELPAEHCDIQTPQQSQTAVVRAPTIAPRKASTPSSSRIGKRVFHQKFGYGTILVTENDRLDIAFDKAGRKKIMANFVKTT